MDEPLLPGDSEGVLEGELVGGALSLAFGVVPVASAWAAF